MHISRIQIRNFRNFREFDIPLSGNAVIVGENRVGKSNLLFALRLVLDAGLPDSARELKTTDIWDGAIVDDDTRVEVHIDIQGFDVDPALLALLTDYRLSSDHTTARLSYVFQKKAGLAAPVQSEADFEFTVFGADEAHQRGVRSDVRRRLCLALLPALRDAETELATWRTSPLRRLLDDAISRVPTQTLVSVANEVTDATARLTTLEPIHELETSLQSRMTSLVGAAQDIRTTLGLTPTDPTRLFRSIRLLIDGGKRGIADASLGSANLALLTLKLEEFQWLRRKNDHNFTLICIEEPEAHLHPHLQRKVFRKLFEDIVDGPLSLFVTTHSPTIASVAPLVTIVVLKQDIERGTQGYSLAAIALAEEDKEDLQRYLDVSRADILFARGVIFVEGDAEEALLPGFARSRAIELDEAGVTVCNVGGTHFKPYVSLALALGLPFAVVTDWDPMADSPPLGRERLITLIDLIKHFRKEPPLTPEERLMLSANDEVLRSHAMSYGVFANTSTLEVEMSNTAVLAGGVLAVLEAERFGAVRRKRIAEWKAGNTPINAEQLLSMIAVIGKGRFAARLAIGGDALPAPQYVANAIDAVVRHA